MSTRIATVFGATGQQGSAVVHAILKDGTFTPRAVTRDVNSDSARALAALGADVVAANLGDKEAVRNAVVGAEAVFLVTIPFDASLPEMTQGTNVIDASKEAGVRFVVFSTLPDVSALSKGKYTNAVQSDEKAKIQGYLEASGLAHASIATGGFFENVLKPFLGQDWEKTDDGYVLPTFMRPNAPTVQTWIGHDMGPAVVALFKQYDTRAAEILGQTFVLGSARMTYEDFAAELSKGFGQPIQVKFAGRVGFPAADDMLDAMTEFTFYPGVTIPDPRLEKLGVKMGSIEEFGRTLLKSYLAEL
ncbi:hypothetical protein BD626DRAFT_499577 [Schizophyllum amplum]|uniref:NmrA-like domain-containing protein n=1 Tax=Schizophyllum amplum TaxID=97359 RepID=A0A550CB61_9AGAR|nr:hypothetical protein BD626DRAFT_499577 [Auriculariopsis ampla]